MPVYVTYDMHLKQCFNTFSCYVHRSNKLNMVNITFSVIMKVIADYDYIYNVIDYNYFASGNGD